MAAKKDCSNLAAPDLSAPPEVATEPTYRPRAGAPTFRGHHRTKTTEFDLFMTEQIESGERCDIPRSFEVEAEQARYRLWLEGEL